MTTALGWLASVGTLSVLVVLVVALRRRSFWVRQLTFPLLVAAAVGALAVLSLLSPAPRLAAALTWALLFLGCVTLFRLASLVIFDVHLNARKGLRLPPLLPAVTMAVVYLLTALISLKLAFPQFDVGPLLATSAVTSLVLGLALQPILGNFFAGIVISIEKPFRLNDWIRVGEQEGRVVAINWRTTHLRTRENDNVVIPNAKLAEERVLNYYYPHPPHLERVRVSAPYGEPPYRVRRLLTDCAQGVPGTLDKPTPDTYVLAFEESAVVYELRVWIDDVSQSSRIASDLRARIWEEFHKAGLHFPYPTRQVVLPPRERRRERDADSAPPAHLFVLEGPERGLSLALDGRPVTIGRSPNSELELSDPNASKEHLRIEWGDGAYRLSDLGSSFGTRVNGRTATPKTALRGLDRISVGDTVIIFESG